MSSHPKSGASSGILWATVIATLPLLYVLGVGGLAYYNPPDSPAVSAYVAPYMWLKGHTPLERPLQAFGDWCYLKGESRRNRYHHPPLQIPGTP